MPLGGIGTGNVAIAADGSLRQWQLHNIGNHVGALPGSFLSLRVTRIEPPLDEVRILQARPAAPTATPLVNDDQVPGWITELLSVERPMSVASFAATYPIAEICFTDDDLPLGVTLEALNPMAPLNTDDSSLPAVMRSLTLVNNDRLPLHGTVGIAQQNPVGWDGVSPIDGVDGAGYGGNINRLERAGGWTSLLMENVALADDHPGQGQFIVATDSADVAALLQWQRAAEMMAFLRSRALASGGGRWELAAGTPDPQRHAPRAAVGPSVPGRTWNGGLGVPFWLEPGQQRTVKVLLAWHFPNRYVNFEQFGPERPEWGRSQFWLGDHYTTRHADVRAVRDEVIAQWSRLRDATAGWTSTFADSSLDDQAAEHLAAQLSLVRSPTCFRSADGRFFGFEGTLGKSTVMWSGEFGGSCPLNCTHVWNYEHTLAKTFPELERSMRETEFDIAQAPQGYIPHRVIVPVYLPQLWDQQIGGPEQPALDGMLGTVLKTYREYRAGAGDEWLNRYWPQVRCNRAPTTLTCAESTPTWARCGWPHCWRPNRWRSGSTTRRPPAAIASCSSRHRRATTPNCGTASTTNRSSARATSRSANGCGAACPTS